VRKKPEPAKEAGDMIQADTIEVPLFDDVVVYIMNAVDVVTRQIWSHLCVANNSENAAILLSKVCEDRVPKRIQTDGGSEFRGHQLGIVQHVLPPISPKLNGHVECVNANIVREFLNFWIPSGDLKELEASLAQFVYEYYHIRPHEALDFETPNEWYNARAA